VSEWKLVKPLVREGRGGQEKMTSRTTKKTEHTVFRATVTGKEKGKRLDRGETLKLRSRKIL